MSINLVTNHTVQIKATLTNRCFSELYSMLCDVQGTTVRCCNNSEEFDEWRSEIWEVLQSTEMKIYTRECIENIKILLKQLETNPPKNIIVAGNTRTTFWSIVEELMCCLISLEKFIKKMPDGLLGNYKKRKEWTRENMFRYLFIIVNILQYHYWLMRYL